MIITAVDISVETIPLKTPFITALRRVEHVEFVRVMVTNSEGLTGIGEAPPTKAITGEETGSIMKTVRELIAPRLLNKPLGSMEEAQSLLHGSCEGNSSAKAAVDIALYDLFAKHSGELLCSHLGSEPRSLVTDVTISLNPPEQMADDARKAIEAGFDILKVKVGGRDGLDLDRIQAVRRAAPHATLLIDANQAWSEAESLAFIEAVKHLDIALIEQPVPAGEFESMQTITAKSPIPILADESVFTLEDAKRVIGGGAAHMINIKLMKCGGIHKAREILALCKANGIRCMMGSMLEGPVSIAAALHLSLCYPETILFCDLDSPLLYRALPDGSPLDFEHNRLSLRARTGITG